MHIKTSDQEEFKIGFGDFTINWGAHICGLYETEEERDEIIFGFLKQGIIDDNICIYIPTERTHDDFKQKFSDFCPDCSSNHNGQDKITLLNEKDFYYPSGKFSPKDMIKIHEDFYAESQKNGRKFVRGTAEMVWALKAIPNKELLMVYESCLNYFIPGKPWTSICLYNINKFSGSQIMTVLQTHPLAISKMSIIQNPYYIEPDIWLAENAPEYLKNRN
jgi:hypothetical protein